MTADLDCNVEPTENKQGAYGWMGSVQDFLALPADAWLTQLGANYQRLYQQSATATQKQAWQDSGDILRSQLSHLQSSRPDSQHWTLIFEYELPREGGRRPDVVLLGAGQIVVFEFKQKARLSLADSDQVAAYARDLATYHQASHHHPVIPVLVPTRANQPFADERPQADPAQGMDKVTAIAPAQIGDYLHQLQPLEPKIDAEQWVQSDYAPLPSVIQAAQQIFREEPLPSIRQAHSAGIPDLLNFLHQLTIQAQRHNERHLVLITGVPGAGKTLVGLQYVYQNPRSATNQAPNNAPDNAPSNAKNSDKPQSIFLTGNAPLVQVLQYALQSKVFVQAVRNFYLQYEVRRQTAPPEQIIVFDEAQRAWNCDRMSEKYGIDSAASGAILRIAERIPDWSIVVALIGKGQTIHVGEDDGIEQWNQSLQATQMDWQVHCAPAQAQWFSAVPPERLQVDEQFNLSLSLRSHLAQDVQTWIAELLDGKLEQAAARIPRLQAEGFAAYVTRDLELAKQYCCDRYSPSTNKRYGLLASSRARNLTQYGIPNDYKSTQWMKVGPWYVDPPDSPLSCCAFERVATEFSCQGLELDLPIVCWGSDLRWQAGQWQTYTRQRNVRDPHRLRLNSYRVLLSRGRDGLIVFVPPEPVMDDTYAALCQAGLKISLHTGIPAQQHAG